jgi:hypothetical protein
MRVRHLTDIEIQALLDRRIISAPDSVGVELYRKDLDSQEHLDNCTSCRAELEFYRELYGELEKSATVSLPRNFARKVTFSLPPFRARRTKARLQLAGIWGASLLLSLAWLVGQMNLALPITRLIWSVESLGREIGLIKDVLIAMIPSPEIALTSFMARLTDVVASVQRAFSGDIATISLVMFAGLVVLMIVWVDSFYFATIRQKS